MELSNLLQQTHIPKGKSFKNELKDVYGIIYRIYCIPENKSYVGQTFSHGYNKNFLCNTGILNRCKIHYNKKILESNNKKPLYIALSKYTPNNFIVYEEKILRGKEIQKINKVEAEYIEKFDSLQPNGYNTEEIGKKNTQLLKDLSEFYGFEIETNNYVDKTRGKRVKDICFSVYFKVLTKNITFENILDILKNVEVENVRLVDSNGLRIILRIKDEKDNIRLYFHGTKDECIEFAKKITSNITPKFLGEICYKYQDKIDKVIIDKDIITSITLKKYHNNSRNNDTILIIIYGNKNDRVQSLHRISFGGKSCELKESYDHAVEFVEKLKHHLNLDVIKINIEKISL
jgi:hypothetical protein